MSGRHLQKECPGQRDRHMGRLEEAHVAGVEAAKASVEMTSR